MIFENNATNVCQIDEKKNCELKLTHKIEAPVLCTKKFFLSLFEVSK